LLLPVHLLQAVNELKDNVTDVKADDHLLAREGVGERLEIIVLFFHAELSTAFLTDALLPQHVLVVENKWL